jgi:4-amino-4-deoxy-L-arabinose transferase-like glycosyltransferase
MRFWPLLVVLAVQAGLSLRLVWSATAFLDEGEYLAVGHLELNHFLHHAPMPNVATYLSGSPVVYPPLAAMADNIGGLAAARLLSLIFMLIATACLYGVARRLLASDAGAFFAAALFAWLGTAQFLGAFATYDAMALMLLALATWLGVRAVEEEPTLRYTLLCAAGLAMAVSDAAKYAAALFNPVVLIVIALAAWRADGRKAGLDALGAVALATALPLTLGYDLAGPATGQGLTSTTLTRSGGTDSVRAVLDLSAHATGIIAVLAVLGAILVTVRRPGWAFVLLAWALAGAEFLAPAEQARIHTLTSLFKHVGYGAWFACVIAGYLLAEIPALLGRLRKLARSRTVPALTARPRWTSIMGYAAAVAGVVAAGLFGITVANGQFGDWANSTTMVATLNRIARPNGYYLVEDPSVVTYYLRSKIPFSHIESTYPSFNYVDPQTHQMLLDLPAFADAIKHGRFSAIVLAYGDTLGEDEAIIQDIDTDHNYKVAYTIPYQTSFGPSQYRIWVRVPAPVKPVKHHKKRHRAAASPGASASASPSASSSPSP